MANLIKGIKAIKKTRLEFGKPKVKKPIKISKAETKANARGLKAANKPLSKGNAKRSLQIKQQAGYIAYDRRPTPPSVKAAMGGKKPDGMRGAVAAAKKIAMDERRSSSAPKKISPAQKALNKKLGR